MKNTAWLTKILQKLNFYKKLKKKIKRKKKEENRKEAPMTAFPKTLIHFNRKSRAALQRKVETDRKTRIKYGKMWKITLKNLIQFTDAAQNKL